MVRPRWHDALLVVAILSLLTAGVWALWWDDVRVLLRLDPTPVPSPTAPASPVAVAPMNLTVIVAA